MGLFEWFREKAQAAQHRPTTPSSNASGIYFEGGTGETVDTAVVVRGAKSDLEGTAVEFAWLVEVYGQKDRDWKLLTHSHGKYWAVGLHSFRIITDHIAMTWGELRDITEQLFDLVPDIWTEATKFKLTPESYNSVTWFAPVVHPKRAGRYEFVDIRRERRRGLVHGVANGIRHDIDDEFADLPQVGNRVLLGTVRFRTGRKDDGRWIRTDPVEKRKRGQVVHAGGGDGGDKGDRTRKNR